MNFSRNGGPTKTARSNTSISVQSDYNSANGYLLHEMIRNELFDMGLDGNIPLPELGRVRIPGYQKMPGNTACSIIIYSEFAFITDFSTGLRRTVRRHCHGGQIYTTAKRAENQRQIHKTIAQREKLQLAGSLRANRIWQESKKAPIAGYLARKGLSCTHGARWHARNQHWTIALTDVQGKIHNVQRIYDVKWRGSDKWFLKGAPKKGFMVIIGNLVLSMGTVLVAEGFATGATLREKSGMVVACAMDSGNLKSVCQALRSAYPFINIVVCGDDDRYSLRNVGREKAIEAAKSVGGSYCFPPVSEKCASCTDFNDLVSCEVCGGAS